ncbi:MAG TPA: hypothetical protein VFR59_01600 [Steroidobacteraceae bacterium]|nr:hypothetical protein [Steroidobacteraceae bacterium]
MRALIGTLIAFLFFGDSHATSLNLYTPVQIAPGTWLLAPTVPGEPEVGVVIGERSVAVIGAPKSGVYARQILEHVAELTRKPVSHVIVLSHYCDHACASAELADTATVVASDALDPTGPLVWANDPLDGPEYFAGAGIARPALVVRTRATLDLGGRRIVLEKVPGIATALVALQPDTRIVWTGALSREQATPAEASALRAVLAKLPGYRGAATRAGTQATPS